LRKEIAMAKARNGSSESSRTSSNSGLITATIDADTGEIIEVRSVDDAGSPSELTADHSARLSRQSGDATLEDLVEEAFEAGIACVLGEDADGAETSESEEEAALRHQILRPMIENSAARRLMQQGVLGRAIVGTLIRRASDRNASSHPSPGP
jgi:hypothetical protein